MTVSQRLSKLIDSSEYSYEQLGTLTGIAKSSIQRYASGNTKKIPIDAIEKIAPYLGVSAVYILGWDEDSSCIDKITKALNERPMFREVVEKVLQLDDESLQAFSVVLKGRPDID